MNNIIGNLWDQRADALVITTNGFRRASQKSRRTSLYSTTTNRNMKNIKGNLWDQKADALVISTNGFRKADGSCVMGKGCAKEAALRFPSIPSKLGAYIGEYGNRVINLGVQAPNIRIVAFPVKPVSEPFDGENAVAHMAARFTEGLPVPGWACKARPDIILRSAKQLVAMADKFGWTSVVLPRPGCGCGELSWDDVGPLLEAVLDDRFSVITFK